ncbi:MAG: two-component regulator propeller domain-containing protein [Rubrivivax sp.]|nr:two-component regulator propeller domain-containing protein [Rubrivivax sp.]
MIRPPCPRAPAPALRRWLRRTAAVLVWLGGTTGALATAPAPERWQAWAADGFQHITSADGLPNEIATAVAEDGDGFIWTGTAGGLARWDGYQLRVHRFEPGRPGGLPDNLVQVMHRDAAGRLWIGTSGGGLARYEPASERFVTLGAGPEGLSHVSVRTLADDGAGGLWVGTDGGLDHIDGGTGKVSRIALGAKSSAGLAGDRVVALLRDGQGRLWAGTSLGLYRRSADGQRFDAVPLLGAADTAGPDARLPAPESLLQDSAGRIWVGTDRRGAFVIDADGAAVRPIVETSGVPPGGKSLTTRRVMSLVEARPGEIWIGTFGQGIVAVDAASGRTRRLSHRPLAAASLRDDSVRGLLRDRQGLVWVATNGGLSRLDPRNAAVLTVSSAGHDSDGNRVRADYSALLAHSDGRLWMGTHVDGIEIVDPQRGTSQALRPNAARPDSALPPDVAASFAEADDGSVYVASYRGLYRATADGRRVTRMRWPGRRPDAGVGPLLRDGHRLWVGGLTDGLWQLDLRSGRVQATLSDPARQLTDMRITALARGPDGAVWIGTRNGLNRLQPASGTLQRIEPGLPAEGRLAAGFISSLLFDRSDRLWVGVYGGGVHLMEPGSDAAPRFRRVSAAEGLPDDSVNALVEDEAGRMWASTDAGVAVLDTGTLHARALRRADGLVFLSYWTNSGTRTAAGEVIFGASGGLTVVRPALLQTWEHRPPVVVTDIRIGGRPVLPGKSPALQVPADANSLTVEFAALDYSAPERNRYAHRLVGYDAGWVQHDARHRLASYSNLPPGDYVLQLRGSNRDGVFSEGALALPVRVQAAWHQTAAFRAAVLLAALAALYAVVHLRTRALQTRRRELQRLVDERTAELQAVSRALTEKSRALEEKSRVLEHASISDPLTGLHNRRFLTEHIDGLLAASQRRAQDRAGPPGAPVDTDTLFFMIDVDHFKRVNDDLGHAAGDTVLLQLAQRLQVAMRESDNVVRWGGEEFLAVAHGTDRARADELAERIRASVADIPFRLADGRTLAMTCSVGHACWPFLPQHPQALDWLGVVDLADIGLLAAKRLGRNAWVGLHGTERTPQADLLTLVRRKPRQALARGELRVSSSSPTPAAVAEALQAP